MPIVSAPQALTRLGRIHNSFAGWTAVGTQFIRGECGNDTIGDSPLKLDEAIQIIAYRISNGIVCLCFVFL
jgi:hypothetical protein